MKDMDKHNKIRIQSWCKKFCQIVANVNWKKNRNLHALNLLDMILNEHFEEPYNKFPPEGPLPYLPIAVIKSRLSPKILNYAKYIFTPPISENRKNENLINTQDNKNIRKGYKNNNSEMKKSQSVINNLLYKNKMILEIGKCNDPDLLKRLIEKLKFKVDETRKIINEQNEEKKILAKKVSQLENLLKSYKI
jgi:hypothetical protein